MSFRKIDEILSFSDHLNHINHYQLVTKPNNQNSGTAIWAFASKNGNGQFFIKCYLNPKGPSSICDESEYNRRSQECKDFLNHKKDIFKRVYQTNSPYLLKPIDFFYLENSFYVTYIKLVAVPFDFSLAFDQKIDIFSKIVEAILELHRNHVVHADIKMNNVIFTKNEANEIIPYVIDLDSAYVSGHPPDEIINDSSYASPESSHYNKKKDHQMPIEDSDLTIKSDIYSLGILLHYMLFEKILKIDHDLEFSIDYSSLHLSKSQEDKLDDLFRQMLAPFSTRISANQVLNKLIYLFIDEIKISEQDFNQLTTHNLIKNEHKKTIKKSFEKTKECDYIVKMTRVANLKDILKKYQVNILKDKIDCSNITPLEDILPTTVINFDHLKIEKFTHPTIVKQDENKTPTSTVSLLKGKILKKH